MLQLQYGRILMAAFGLPCDVDKANVAENQIPVIGHATHVSWLYVIRNRQILAYYLLLCAGKQVENPITAADRTRPASRHRPISARGAALTTSLRDRPAERHTWRVPC